MAEKSNRSRKRIQTTQICTGWDGASSVTASCPNNAGLAQHDLKVVPSGSTDTGCVLVWLRPIDCAYYVRLGYLRLSTGEMAFRGLFDAIRLDVATPWAGITVTASISSIGTTFNSSSSEDNETQWRRRYVHTTLAKNWDGVVPSSQSQSVPDHVHLSQHMLSIGGGTGSVQMSGSLGSGPFVLLGSVDASGGFLVFTGYYDNILLSANAAAGAPPMQADLHSIGQELLLDTTGPDTGSPMTVSDGDIGAVPVGKKMVWSSDGETEGNGSLDISGAFEDSTAVGGVQGSPLLTNDFNVDVVPLDRLMVWSGSGEIEGSGSLEIDGAFVEV